MCRHNRISLCWQSLSATNKSSNTEQTPTASIHKWFRLTALETIPPQTSDSTEMGHRPITVVPTTHPRSSYCVSTAQAPAMECTVSGLSSFSVTMDKPYNHNGTVRIPIVITSRCSPSVIILNDGVLPPPGGPIIPAIPTGGILNCLLPKMMRYASLPIYSKRGSAKEKTYSRSFSTRVIVV